MNDQLRILAATAWRRTGVSWRECGQRLGIDKDRLREMVTATGRADGYAPDDPLRGDRHSISSFVKSKRKLK